MSNWDDIPDALLPDPSEKPILELIATHVREAVRIRHDFQGALKIFRRERHLPLPPLESTIGKSTKSTDPNVYVKEHEKRANVVKSLIQSIKTDALRVFLSEEIKHFFPDISLELKPGAPKFLFGNTTVLNELVPHREDMLIRLLILAKMGPFAMVKGIRKPIINPFLNLDRNYYF